jgi:E3 ubiquitin-protein ligase RNF115/126
MSASPNPDDHDRPAIQGHLMAQYLMNLLSQHEISQGSLGGNLENGRMGDYVFNQEALDQVITQIMEHSNAHRPVPATEEIIGKLPREVLMEASKTLEQDCAVCKEQFILGTEDPDEQIVITLPCKHPFHMPCILPWLKSSGTCPVCRHALIPQPDHHPPPTGPGPDFDGSRGPRRFNSGSDASGSRAPEPGGLFHSIFGGFGNNNINGNNERSGSGFSGSERRFSDPTSSRRNRRNNGHNDRHLPGGWSEDLD